jgi:HNH endonuclease
MGTFHNTPKTFWARVSRTDPSNCWEWQGGRNRVNGYGKLSFDSKPWFAHRLAYKLANPEWDGRLHVLHRCDNPGCCNPSHLFLGTDHDNIADMMAKGRHVDRRKLTEEQVIEIRASVELLTILAAKFKVSQATISLARSGKTWRHVTAPTRRMSRWMKR